jgi:hypothetical protein
MEVDMEAGYNLDLKRGILHMARQMQRIPKGSSSLVFKKRADLF